MPTTNLGYWDYLKAAFHWKMPVPLLGAMPLNKFALAGFGILGFGNPGFWLLGMGYEASYLLWLSGSSRFQNVVKGKQLAERQQGSEEIKQGLIERLDKDSRWRYNRLAAKCRDILQADTPSSFANSISDMKSERLGELLMIFLKLLNLRSRVLSTLQYTDKKEIETDVAKLQAAIAAESETSAVRKALQGTLEIQNTRLENLDRSRENLRFTETELDRIEKQVSLLAEESAVTRTPEQWSSTLDGVVKSLQGTSKWMVENSELFEAMDNALPSRIQMPPPVPRTKN